MLRLRLLVTQGPPLKFDEGVLADDDQDKLSAAVVSEHKADCSYHIGLPSSYYLEFIGAPGSYMPAMGRNVRIDTGADCLAIPATFWAEQKFRLFSEHKAVVRTAGGGPVKAIRGFCYLKIWDESKQNLLWPPPGVATCLVRACRLPKPRRRWGADKKDKQWQPHLLMNLDVFGGNRLCIHTEQQKGGIFSPASRQCLSL